MTDPVPYGVTYPGLKIIKADMVHTHGVTPSVCYCTAIPEVPTPATTIADGTLTFTRAGAPFFFFRHCAIRAFYLQAPGPRNNLRAEVEIIDRRHLWKNVTIGGRYNAIDSTGEIDASYAKTWQQLFAIVLEALGETDGSYEITVPDDAVPAPAVYWDNTRADLALADLAEQAACAICLTNDDRIVIEPIGHGPVYFAAEDARVPILPFPAGLAKPAVAVEFAQTRYQMWIKCEAMAVNNDTTLTALEDADWMDDYETFRQHNAPGVYNDTGDAEAPWAGVKTDERSRTVFRKQKDMLYRMYRIKELYHYEDNTLPLGGHFNTIDDILPLYDVNLFRIRPSVDSPETPLEADIQETWNTTPDNTPPFVLTCGVGDFSWPVDKPEKGAFFEEPGQPTIDVRRGIIYFDRFVFAIDEDGYTEPAEVYINATFSVRHPDTGLYRRYRYEPGGDSPFTTRRYESIYLYVDVPADPDDPIHSNRDILQQDIGPGLSSRYSFTGLTTSFVQWNGLKNYSVRGNVPQMHWHLDGHRIYTEGGHNFEHPILSPVHEMRLHKEHF